MTADPLARLIERDPDRLAIGKLSAIEEVWGWKQFDAVERWEMVGELLMAPMWTYEHVMLRLRAHHSRDG